MTKSFEGAVREAWFALDDCLQPKEDMLSPSNAEIMKRNLLEAMADAKLYVSQLESDETFNAEAWHQAFYQAMLYTVAEIKDVSPFDIPTEDCIQIKKNLRQDEFMRGRTKPIDYIDYEYAKTAKPELYNDFNPRLYYQEYAKEFEQHCGVSLDKYAMQETVLHLPDDAFVKESQKQKFSYTGCVPIRSQQNQVTKEKEGTNKPSTSTPKVTPQRFSPSAPVIEDDGPEL